MLLRLELEHRSHVMVRRVEQRSVRELLKNSLAKEGFHRNLELTSTHDEVNLRQPRTVDQVAQFWGNVRAGIRIRPAVCRSAMPKLDGLDGTFPSWWISCRSRPLSGVSSAGFQGGQPKNLIILLAGTPKMVPLILGTSPNIYYILTTELQSFLLRAPWALRFRFRALGSGSL